MAIGPALTGVYLDSHKAMGEVPESYPSSKSYNLVYLTSALLSAVSLGLMLMLKKRAEKKEIEV
jgi:hypothetical protein